ncbi:hypothetical protein BP6252_13064 [Coleophoma cylindrospora]|uniref:Uncharacterized protein n=1 Tax=Coleophoma cylindrospora TaxID=1849047 RepID=A0A3D8QAE8_9HELO|nr:hypothetical protein BP6252_13064 [Coleophoma cylindrospora]
MLVITRTALIGTLASLVAAQSVDLFLPGFGAQGDTFVAQSVGQNAGVTSYLVGCASQSVYTVACIHRSGPGRDGGLPNCDGAADYNTVTDESCGLTAGGTVLQGPSTLYFVAGGSNSFTQDCSADGRVSAVCTRTFTEYQTSRTFALTISGSEFTFVNVPLTTGVLTANGPLPTLTPAVAQASTTIAAPSTTSTTSPPPVSITPTTTSSTTTITGSSTESQSSSSSAEINSSSFTSSSSLNSTTLASSTTTTTAINRSSNATTAPSVPTVNTSGATGLTEWTIGAAAAAVFAIAATL